MKDLGSMKQSHRSCNREEEITKLKEQIVNSFKVEMRNWDKTVLKFWNSP